MTHANLYQSGHTVVLVEDEGVVRELAACELADSGYRVVEFETADAALPYLRQHGREAAVLVTDVQMPGSLNGLDLVEIVGRILPETPVIVTSGGTMVDPSRLPRRARFLPKPWRADEIVERVRAALGVPAAGHERALPSGAIA